MTSYGIVEEGFNQKTLEDILAELDDAERDAFGAALNTTPESIVGQMNAIFGDKVAELWEVLGAVYASQYPDSAQDASLDNVAAITGALRLAATQTMVTLRLNLNPGVILLAGRVVSVSASGARFITQADVSNADSVQRNVSVDALAEDYGPVLGSAGTIDTIETPVAGWVAQAGMDSANSEVFALANGFNLQLVVDGGAAQLVTFVSGDFVDITNATAAEVASSINAQTTGITASDANGQVRMVSDTDGPGSSLQVTGGTANAVLGFTTALVAGMNDEDGELGRDLETDQAFRLRREELLRIAGAATVEAIRSTVRDVADVLQAFVFENTTLVTDSNGLPGKSIEVVVQGGDDGDIANAIFNSKAAGIGTYGSPSVLVSVPIEDSQGVAHIIDFSRPNAIRYYITMTVTVNLAAFGAGDQDAGEQQIKDALSVEGQTQNIGEDVIILRYRCVPLEIAGVVDVTDIKIDDVSPPTNTANIPLGVRDLATFDTADIVINVVAV